MTDQLFRTAKDFTEDEKARLLEQFQKSGLGYAEFAREHNINNQTMKNWVCMPSSDEVRRKHYSPTERKKILEAFLSAGIPRKAFAETWGVSEATITKWSRAYEADGAEGLMNKRATRVDDGRVGSRIPGPVQEAVVAIKRAQPEFGLQRVRDFLYRFRGMKISRGGVRATMQAHGIPVVVVKKKRKKSSDRVRRFERAKPMQLWQSDITQFTLGQYWQRVYLTVFMDDHSRYIVGWRLQSRQTAELVLDAFKDGTTRYGKPVEVLTDQGRQYFAWRGKSELEKVLEREGIKHVVSRAHHPQTLGKCERFWETIANEFWSRARPQELEEARVRLKHFIDHYNYQRPHQGLDGQVPADRFFGVAAEVREVLEKSVERNALKMAIGELPTPPAFLIGQIGDQRIAFHGTSGRFYLTHENLKEDEIKDGATGAATGAGFSPITETGVTGPGIDEIAEESFNEAAQEANDTGSDREIPAGADAWALGAGQRGGEGPGRATSAGDHELLDGPGEQGRCVPGTFGEAGAFLAVNGSGGQGHGSGVTLAAATAREEDAPGCRAT